MTVGAISVSDQWPPKFSSSTPGPRKTRGTRRLSEPVHVFLGRMASLAFRTRKAHAVVGCDHQKDFILAAGFGQSPYRRIQGFNSLQISF